MPTLDQIKQQISTLDGGSRLLGWKEIKELPSILWDDENIERLVQGTYNNGLGILVATNKRLIFVDKGMLYGIKVEDFPYDKITSIQYETGLILGKISIFASGNRADIEAIEKGQARSFSEYVRARVSSVTTHARTAPAPSDTSKLTSTSSAQGEELLVQLERLATLRQQDMLTAEEFTAAKKRLLGL